MSRRAGVALWAAFAAVHAWLTWVGVVVVPAESFADVDLYRWWMHLGLEYGHWPVLDGPWVYPAGALLPMVLPALGTTWSTTGYALGWCALVAVLDAVATAALVAPARGAHAPAGPERTAAAGAWWWLAFLALLGPVAIGRLDGVVAPLMVLALVHALRRPAVAAALATLGAWVKVAPGALLLPLLAAARRPVREVLAPAAGVCAVVVGLVAAGGGLGHVASFVTTQTTRGLQTESVAATGWVVAGLWRDDVRIELNDALITWEVHGPGTTAVLPVLDLLLVLGVAALAGALWLARLEGRAAPALSPGALALLAVLVVTNRVGSPQFLAWLAAPVAVALARPDRAPARWRRSVATTALVAAALTQVVYPWWYAGLLTGDPLTTALLALRNTLLVVLLALGVAGLVAVLRRGADDGAGADVDLDAGPR